MRVLVTGPAGFLGGEIVDQLLERGDEVVGVSRGSYPDVVAKGVDYRQGDLTDKAFTLEAIRDVDVVVHTAAIAGVWGPDEQFERINTSATEHVIEACRSNGIKRLVFTSSPSVTFDGEDQCELDESAPYPERWLCAYPRTKAAAEQSVLASHQLGHLHTCALRPHLVWGEDDPHLLARVIDRAKAGQLKIVGDGKNLIDTVHVINAAAAHLDAIDALDRQPEIAGGRAYFIAQDEPVNCWHWIGTICEAAGVPVPRKRVPYRVAYSVGAMLEMTYQVLGRQAEPPMTRFVAAQLAKHHYFDITAAKERLGYRVRISMAEGLQRLRDAWAAR
ncbi:NAD-dependent epimerase/dehydratase family protein [Rhodopirellula sp. MGV]|uniref:NAD-dependent epimerase/dehydratase family protein n=1 Tax=Rhodopirellula sp. MGV TaxID=2023130 RepID=UPI000B9641F1|nr:NAD-dependent epimerase/dehydratase family protein [Rhodopirellula sp. MGV]OYP28941.1 3-beta hydroxysteroid dehydrogenase [Rhodopirellula sp. MGV]PNY36942.1 3-beta hydroxysteroid dehydrogenase [Rhodopirellula baltica]